MTRSLHSRRSERYWQSTALTHRTILDPNATVRPVADTGIDPGDVALIESWQLNLYDRSARTRHVYTQAVSWWAGWLAEQGLGLLTASKQDAERWIRSMQQRGLKGSTIRIRMIPVGVFYKWAVAEGELEASPVERVTVKKTVDPAPDTLTPAQVAALLKACEGTAFKDRRDLAIIRLMLATGLRASETCALELRDLDLANRIAAVRHGKGDKQRAVRFDPATAAALDRYRRVRARHRLAPSPLLWLGQRGPLTAAGGLPDIMESRGAKAGIEHLFPHMLRHTWADRWLGAGGQEGDLKVLGGWESDQVMRRYGSARAADRALSRYDDIDPMRGL